MTRYPWTHSAALDAIGLRRLGMSYSAIAIALEHYHGFRPTATSVSHLCHTAGCPQRPNYADRPQQFGSTL